MDDMNVHDSKPGDVKGAGLKILDHPSEAVLAVVRPPSFDIKL